MSLRLAQINIERDRHIDTVSAFLKAEMPDVVCLQEVFEEDVPRFAELVGATAQFAGTMIWEGKTEGIAVLSRLPFMGTHTIPYAGTPHLREFIEGTAAEKHATMRYILLGGDFEKDGAYYRIMTTHFTWTPDGEADDFQRADMAALLTTLDPLNDLVLTGDFNAPRGKEIWEQLAERFKDNVPPQYVSSLDRNLHRAGHLDYIVDGIFSTPLYKVSDVELRGGVSDHCALIATISKAK